LQKYIEDDLALSGRKTTQIYDINLPKYNQMMMKEMVGEGHQPA